MKITTCARRRGAYHPSALERGHSAGAHNNYVAAFSSERGFLLFITCRTTITIPTILAHAHTHKHCARPLTVAASLLWSSFRLPFYDWSWGCLPRSISLHRPPPPRRRRRRSYCVKRRSSVQHWPKVGTFFIWFFRHSATPSVTSNRCEINIGFSSSFISDLPQCLVLFRIQSVSTTTRALAAIDLDVFCCRKPASVSRRHSIGVLPRAVFKLRLKNVVRPTAIQQRNGHQQTFDSDENHQNRPQQGERRQQRRT